MALPTSIVTGIEFGYHKMDNNNEDDIMSAVTEPLLQNELHDRYSKDHHHGGIIHEVDDTDTESSSSYSTMTKSTTNDEKKRGRRTSHRNVNKACPLKLVTIGTVTGFLIQIISLGAYAFLILHFGNVESSYGIRDDDDDNVAHYNYNYHREDDDTSSSKDIAITVEADWVMYGVLSLLTQVDLLLYVVIWTAFTCTMTRTGMDFLRLQYQILVHRRSLFLMGIYFLVGVVLGAFGAWTTIDFYLGFPVPFLPIAATVLVDLALCHLMVFCFDLGSNLDSPSSSSSSPSSSSSSSSTSSTTSTLSSSDSDNVNGCC